MMIFRNAARALIVLALLVVTAVATSCWFPLVTPHLIINRGILDISPGNNSYFTGPYGFSPASKIHPPWDSVAEVWGLPEIYQSSTPQDRSRIPLGIPLILLVAATGTIWLMGLRPMGRTCRHCRALGDRSRTDDCAACGRTRRRAIRSRRLLRILAWIVALAGAASLLFALMTIWIPLEFSARAEFRGNLWYGDPIVTARGGTISIRFDPMALKNPFRGTAGAGYRLNRARAPSGGAPTTGSFLYPTVTGSRFLTNSVLTVPLWLIVAPLAVFSCVLFRNTRRVPPHQCQSCNYNLTGNVSGRCPECGAEILKPEAAGANEAGGGNATGV